MDELYDNLLTFGRREVSFRQECGNPFKRQLQDLHDYVYVVESTPEPEDPTHSPMFLCCVVHRSLWVPEVRQRLEDEHISYNVVDYGKMTRRVLRLADTKKRRLLFEMLGKWWFFENTLAPNVALTEAVQFRNDFFSRKELAPLPGRFRQLTEEMAFHEAVNALTPEEHALLDGMLLEMEMPVPQCCGLLKQRRKGAFYRRLDEPHWEPTVGEENVDEAIWGGTFLWATFYNYYDCTDRNLYTKIYDIFSP